MKTYFTIHLNRLNRFIKDSGISSWIIIPFGFIIFLAVSYKLFLLGGVFHYVYTFISFSILYPLSSKPRNDFLKTIFSNEDYYKLRITENLIVVSPLILFALMVAPLTALFIILSSITLSWVQFTGLNSYTVPTIFSRPHEFIMGFRYLFFLFPIPYLLGGISIWLNNFNIALFALILMIVYCLTFFSGQDYEYHIWNFNKTSRSFLFKKYKNSSLNLMLLITPLIILLIAFFKSHILLWGSTIILGFIYLLSFILAKYASYPHQLDIGRGIMLGISIIFPPLVLLTIPIFFTESIKKLKPILDDPN